MAVERNRLMSYFRPQVTSYHANTVLVGCTLGTRDLSLDGCPGGKDVLTTRRPFIITV